MSDRAPAPRRGHRVVFLVFDGAKLLDVSGPAEVFAEAGRSGAAYELSYVSPTGEPVATSVGLTLPVAGDPESVDAIDTLIVSGGDSLPVLPIPPAVVEAAGLLHGRAGRTVSICTGSFILAAAGLLDGRRATTHWRHADLLARAYPRVSVLPDALFVHDRGIHTSAGVSAGIDLALALVQADHGPSLAREVARNLVMFMQRPGGQSQFSAPLQGRPPSSPSIRGLVEHIHAHPAQEHTVASMASSVSVSERHLTRLFAQELDTSPAKFVESARLEHAQALLDAGHGVAEAARRAGFGSPETMRRLFRSRFGVSPSEYRDRFTTT